MRDEPGISWSFLIDDGSNTQGSYDGETIEHGLKTLLQVLNTVTAIDIEEVIEEATGKNVVSDQYLEELEQGELEDG